MRRKRKSNSFLSGETNIIVKFKECLSSLKISELKYREGMEVLTPKGWKKFDGVTHHGEIDDFYKITFDDSSYIKCTSNHQLQLKTGDWCRTNLLLVGATLLKDKKVIDITKCSPQEAYGLINVEETQSYMTNGVVSHNCSIGINNGLRNRQL